MNDHLPGAIIPYIPYPRPVEIPVSAPSDFPMICLQINADWLPYLIGCAKALTVDSTWASEDTALVQSATANGNDLLDILSGGVDCAVNLIYRSKDNVSPPVQLQYSTDGGATWIDMPDFSKSFVRTRPVNIDDNDINPVNYFATKLYLKSGYADGKQLSLFDQSSQDFLRAFVDDGSGNPIVERARINPIGNFQLPIDSALPAANATQHGVISTIGAPFVDDRIYICTQAADGSYRWSDFAGANGTPGTPGATGATGANGTPGATGTNGTNGAPGATGATGATGASGANGATGATGAAATCADCATPIPMIPPIAGHDRLCDLSVAITLAFADILKSAHDVLAIGSSTAAMISGISPLLAALELGPIGAIGTVASGLLGLTSAVIDSQFNNAQYSALQCDLYCHGTASPASFTDSNITAVLAAIAADTAMDSTAQTIFSLLINALGARGLSNALSIYRTAAGDCSSCICQSLGYDWQVKVNLKTSGYHFTSLNGNGGSPNGFVAGKGISSGPGGWILGCHIPFTWPNAPCTIKYAQMHAACAVAQSGGSAYLYKGGEFVMLQQFSNPLATGDMLYSRSDLNIPITHDDYIDCSIVGNDQPGNTQEVWYIDFTLAGTGTAPTFSP